MMVFIRTLVRGVVVDVLLDDGAVLVPEMSLNAEVTHLVLGVQNAQRAIPLADIEHVAVAEELKQGHIVTTIQNLIDERCCTLVVRDSEFVTLRFDNVKAREYFQLCLRTVITHSGNKGAFPANGVVPANPNPQRV